MSADIYDRYIEVCHRSNEQADEIRRLTAERDALRGEVERLRLAADMLREIPRAALSADKVYREDWEELFTDEDGAALYLDTAVDRVLDRITRKESK